MVKVSVKAMHKLLVDMFEKAQVPAEQAVIFADMLVSAEQRGVHSHGITCATRYIKDMDKGLMKRTTTWKVERSFGATQVWDGERGSGQVLGYYGMKEAMELAKKFGVGVVAVKKANHFGAAAYYAQMAQKAGMIGVAIATGDSTMAPWGGADKAIGNNPLAVAVPTRHEVAPVLDMAQSVVANGKVTNLRKQGYTTIPAGWALDKNGVPTTKMADFGSIMPMCGYKGWGTAFIIDVMAGVLFGGGTGDRAKDFIDGPGLLMMAWNIEAFNDKDKFLDDMDARIKELKSVRLATGSKGIMVPGEPEARSEAANKERMDVIEEILDEVDALAEKLGLEPVKPL